MITTLNNNFVKGNITILQYIKVLDTDLESKSKSKSKHKSALILNRYELQAIIVKRELSQQEIKDLLVLSDTIYRTSEERTVIINMLRANFCSYLSRYRDMFLGCLFNHRSILAVFVSSNSLKPSEIKRVWKRDGKGLLKRSQRKLHDYISFCYFFSEYITSEDLEFGVYMACKMPRPDLTGLLLNDYNNKLTANQLERLDAMKILFTMTGQDEIFNDY